MRPLLLDLFCGAGGAATGYHRAGFDVIGVDINPQPNYPFQFIQADVIDFLKSRTWFEDGIRWFRAFSGRPVSAYHASPPCQRYTALAKGNNANVDQYPDLIAPTRELLKQTGLPYVIENVATAPLNNPIVLCGEMFGLGVIRHRKFESNILLLQSPHTRHRGRVAGLRHYKHFTGPYVAVYGTGGCKGTRAQWRAAMGIEWMSKPELAEAIPPAYTQFIGGQLLDAVKAVA